jgi:hypothetical protein
MFLYVLDKLIILIHLVIIFFPLTLFFVKYPNYIYKYLILIPILIIIHWKLLENNCSLTLLQKKIGTIKTESDSGFSEKYLRWFYEPIMNVFQMEWNYNNLDITVNIHWLINFFIIWYFTFF